MSAPRCSCNPYEDRSSAITILFCPLHAAAAQMYRWLDLAADALDMLDLSCGDKPAGKDRCNECAGCFGYGALTESRKVLATARGEEIAK